MCVWMRARVSHFWGRGEAERQAGWRPTPTANGPQRTDHSTAASRARRSPAGAQRPADQGRAAPQLGGRAPAAPGFAAPCRGGYAREGVSQQRLPRLRPHPCPPHLCPARPSAAAVKLPGPANWCRVAGAAAAPKLPSCPSRRPPEQSGTCACIHSRHAKRGKQARRAPGPRGPTAARAPPSSAPLTGAGDGTSSGEASTARRASGHRAAHTGTLGKAAASEGPAAGKAQSGPGGHCGSARRGSGTARRGPPNLGVGPRSKEAYVASTGPAAPGRQA
jgi:hypothetical protein